MRPGVIGAVLLLGSAVSWAALVPAARERARELTRQQRALLAEQAQLARDLPSDDGSAARSAPDREPADGDPVIALRSAVVDVLAHRPLRGVQLDVGEAPAPATARLQLRAAGDLEQLLGLLEALAPPTGSVVLSRVQLQHDAERGLSLDLQGVRLGRQP